MLSQDPFKAMTRPRPSNPDLQDARRRMNQQPAIHGAQETASAALLHPPIGAMMEWPALKPPPSYVFAHGQTLDKLEYPDLYAVLGDFWSDGTETGSQFRLPDRRDRTGVGASTTKPLGRELGEETHSLTLSESPTHDHSGATGQTNLAHSHTGGTGSVDLTHNHGGATGAIDLTHNHGGATGSVDLAHAHGGSTGSVDLTHAHNEEGVTDPLTTNVTGGGTVPAVTSISGIGQSTGAALDLHSHTIPSNLGPHGHTIPAALDLHSHTIPAALNMHSHTISSSLGDHGHAIPAAGGNAAHNNMQPSLAINHIIRALP